MRDDSFEEVDAVEVVYDPWRLGHRRPWWQWNVITLFVSLFLLIWARELFRLSQTATWVTCVGLIMLWGVAPAIYLAPPGPRREEDYTSAEAIGAVDGRLVYLIAAFAMFGAVILTGGFVAGAFSMLAAILYAAAVNRYSR